MWKPQSSWETSSVPVSLQPEDPELKKQVKTNKIVVEDDPLGKIEEKHSCWLKMKRIIALMLKWKISIEQKKPMMPSQSEKVLDFSINNLNLLDVELLQDAEKCIVKMAQSKYFNEELKLLKMKNIDLFGHFIIKIYRKELKRYGVMSPGYVVVQFTMRLNIL